MTSLSEKMMFSSPPTTYHLAETELMCKDGCGYYGNPQWTGYCSRCYKKRAKFKTPSERPPELRLSCGESEVDGVAMDRSMIAMSVFQKDRQTTPQTNASRKLFRRSSSIRDSPVNSSWIESRQPLIFDVDDLEVKPYRELIESLPDSRNADLYKRIKRFVAEVKKSKGKSIDETSEDIQDFYQDMNERFECHPIYLGCNFEMIQMLLDFVENIVLENLYKFITNLQVCQMDEEQDLNLQKRIQSLAWVTTKHLEADIDEQNPEVHDLIDKAVTDILEMDAKRLSQEKLSCIINCSKHIFRIIQICGGGPASADEFLPALVYIVLKTNSGRLKSNIQFITRFTHPTTLMSGEKGYFFTNLCCAVAFIENLTAESLGLSSEEFAHYMSGKVLPPGVLEENSLLGEGLHKMYQNSASMADLRKRQDRLISDTSYLQEQISLFRDNIKEEVEGIVSRNLAVTYSTQDDNPNLVPHTLKKRVLHKRASSKSAVVHLQHADEVLVSQSDANQDQGTDETAVRKSSDMYMELERFQNSICVARGNESF